MPPIDDLEYYGTMAFSLGGMIFTVVSLGLAYITYRSGKDAQELRRDLLRTRDLHAKIDSTLIVTSHLALSNLPKITFTQQIPGEVMNAVSIIDDIFEGGHGAALWTSISKQPELARLAYARAIYKFGFDPLSRKDLTDGPNSVLGLLETAFQAARHSERDPLSLRRDILVRKCQVQRQVQDFGGSMRAAEELDTLRRMYKDDAARHLKAWCLALAHLQQGMTCKTIETRRQAFDAARQGLSETFLELFGKQRWLEVEPRSIAYYTAKAHIGYSLLRDDGEPLDASAAEILPRALDLALAFYQTALDNDVLDPLVRCSYNFCVAFLIFAAGETLSTGTALPRFAKASGKERGQLRLHAALCVEECTKLFDEQARTQWPGRPRFIYSEGTEKLDTLDSFRRDLKLLTDVLEKKTTLRAFYRDCGRRWL